MKILIHGKQFKVDQNLQGYITEKFSKFTPYFKEPAMLEIVLSESMGPKGNDQTVHLTITLPDLKMPFHIEETTADFIGSIDLVQDRFEKFASKYKEKYKIGERYPTKYHEAELEEESEGEL